MHAYERVALGATLLALAWTASPALAGPVRGEVAGDTLAPFAVPAAIAAEHDEIRDALASVAREPSRLGEVASTLAIVMEDHLDREEAYALPPLALLSALARGEAYEEMRDILPITDALAVEIPALVDQHRIITKAARELRATAQAEDRPEIERLAQQIMRHVQVEEQINYPAALLVGAIVESRFGRVIWYPDAR